MPADSGPGGPRPEGRWPATVIARHTARLAARSGALWGYVFGISVASWALGYVSAYKTTAERTRLASLFGSNSGLSAFNGPAHELQTVAGYTVWKTFGFLSILGAAWGLLAATRLLRGEEDAGRWELLLSGQATRKGATAQGFVGLGAGLAALWTVTALVTVVVGHDSKVHIAPASALFFALALVSSAAVFLAAGALASQLAATRRQAAAYAALALGVSYALRMVADAGVGLEWLRWFTPLGWVEMLQPLTAPDPVPLLPIAGLTALLGGLSVHLAGARDLGASVVPDRSSARPHTGLLFGPAGLSVRLTRPVAVGWWAAVAATSVLFGLIAKQGGSLLTSSSSVERVVTRLGAPGGRADAYLGVTFLLIAVLVAVMAAGQVIAARVEEGDGRLDTLLCRPVSRRSWLTGRLSMAAGVVVIAGLTAALFTWLGAASENAGVPLASVLDAGINIVPPALCILGLGVLVWGVMPRAAAAATYGVLAWSFLVELVGGIVGSNHWVLDTSVFHQMAPSPAVVPDWVTGGVMIATGAGAALVGGIAFGRRDLQSA